MKLRMRGGTVRLRVTRSEVAQFAATGLVEEQVAFPSGTLSFRLLRAQGPEVTADFLDCVLTVSVPADRANRWTGTDQVGIGAQAGPLEILIEKDFQCAHGPVEPDTFPPDEFPASQ